VIRHLVSFHCEELMEDVEILSYSWHGYCGSSIPGTIVIYSPATNLWV